MEKSNEERLKKLALKATALLVGGAVVKYLWENGVLQGFIFHNQESGNTFMGIYEGNDLISQMSGNIKEENGETRVIIDDHPIDDQTLSRYENVFDKPTESET